MSFIIKFFRNIINRNNRVYSFDNRVNTTNTTIVRVRPCRTTINTYIEEPKHKCRYCYMDNFQKSMIAPCKCDGSVKYVHIYCLERWRRLKNNPSRCEICNKKYKIPRNNRLVKTYRRFLDRQERDRQSQNRRRTRSGNIRNRAHRGIYIE